MIINHSMLPSSNNLGLGVFGGGPIIKHLVINKAVCRIASITHPRLLNIQCNLFQLFFFSYIFCTFFTFINLPYYFPIFFCLYFTLYIHLWFHSTFKAVGDLAPVFFLLWKAGSKMPTSHSS